MWKAFAIARAGVPAIPVAPGPNGTPGIDGKPYLPCKRKGDLPNNR